MLSRAKSLAVSVMLLSTFAFAQNATVTGTVTYLQRIALPPNAIVKITLEDVSLADAPVKILAEKEIATEGRQVPIPFELAYSPSSVKPSHTYSVRATIKADGRLLFTSTTAYPVLTNGAPAEANILVQQAATQSAAPTIALEGTHWTLIELAGRQVLSPKERQETYLEFAEGNRVSGSTGCNRLTGTYEKNGSELKFHPVATTMMACVGPVMEQENRFNDALRKTTRYRLLGNTLALFNGKTVVAIFKAQVENQQNPHP